MSNIQHYSEKQCNVEIHKSLGCSVGYTPVCGRVPHRVAAQLRDICVYSTAAQRGHTPGQGKRPGGGLHAGKRPASEPPAQGWARKEPGRHGGGRQCRRSRRGKARRTEGPAARPAWEWILLALCLWGALQRGTALVLKGNHVEGEVFAFNALRCDNSHALARYLGRQFCNRGRIKTDNGIPVKVPAGELSVLQLEQEIHF